MSGYYPVNLISEFRSGGFRISQTDANFYGFHSTLERLKIQSATVNILLKYNNIRTPTALMACNPFGNSSLCVYSFKVSDTIIRNICHGLVPAGDALGRERPATPM